MQFEDLMKIWTSPLNEVSDQERRAAKERFERRLRRRRLRERVRLGWGVLMLSISTVLGVWLLAGPRRIGPYDTWASVLLLVLGWAGALWLFRASLRDRHAATLGDRTIVETLQMALAEVNRARRRGKMIAVLYAVVVPLLAVAMVQLRETERASTSELLGMAGLFTAVLLATGGTMLVNELVRLRPRHKRLVTVLGEYEPDA